MLSVDDNSLFTAFHLPMCTSLMVFSCGKNLKTVFGTPFSTENVIFIFVIRRPVPSEVVRPPKIIFRSYFQTYCFFEKIFEQRYSNFSAYKKVTLIFVARRPVPLKQSCPYTNGFLQFFKKILLFLKNLFNSKISST